MTPALIRIPLILIALGTPAAALALTLDAFTGAFPPNPCMPNSGAPVVFVGPMCDGVACPPDPPAGCYESLADQVGLGGVLFGVRRVASVASGAENPVAARVRPELGVVDVTAAGPDWHLFSSRYGTSGGIPTEALHLDLSGLGALAFRVPFSGTVSPAEPMIIDVQLWGGAGQGGPPNAEATVTITSSGDVVIPLSAFVPLYGFSFSDVWGIDVHVADCFIEPCPNPSYPDRAYSIGPITIDTAPTPAAAPSWGTLKTR